MLARCLEAWLAAAPTGERAEALVVLGAAVRRGRPGRLLGERLDAAARAWRAGAAPTLVVTGAGEAEVMRRELVARGVAAEAILVEGQARSTWENARYTRALLAAEGLDDVLVVTQPFHRRRSLRAFRRCGLAARALAFEGSWVRPSALLRELGAVAVYEAVWILRKISNI